MGVLTLTAGCIYRPAHQIPKTSEQYMITGLVMGTESHDHKISCLSGEKTSIKLGPHDTHITFGVLSLQTGEVFFTGLGRPQNTRWTSSSDCESIYIIRVYNPNGTADYPVSEPYQIIVTRTD